MPIPRRVALSFLFISLTAVSATNPKITITRTGSTNTVGFEVIVEETGSASIQPQAQAVRHVKLSSSTAAEFTKNVAAGPLSALPAGHCMKSASFGSSLFITRGDDRSPDLSCPNQPDSRAASLKKQAEDILRAAQKASGVHAMKQVIE